MQNIVAPSLKIKICCSWIWFLLHLIWGGDDRFFGFVFKGERNVSYFFFIFAAYPWTRKCVFFSILIDWLRKSRVRNWNDNFLIGKKNCSENPKHHYVAFQLPRNTIKSIASLFFLHDRKNFCSCDEHFSPQKFQFRMALSCRFSSLRTPTTISVFLNLNICFAEITGPALNAMRTFNICKLLRTFFLRTDQAFLLD